MVKKVYGRFIYPVILVMALDFLFTVIGQPNSYWINSANVNEGSPLGFNLLKINPFLFLIFCAVYLSVMVILIRKLPLILGAILALSLFFRTRVWLKHLG